MGQTSVEQLFLRFAKRGDANALATVFDRCAPEILRVARHLTADESAAEDVVQSTFVAAMEQRARYDGERPLRPWLVGLVTVEARRWQAERRRRPDPLRLDTEPTADPGCSASEHEFTHALGRALDELDEPYRTVASLHLREGLQPAEIASRVDRAPGTVRSQLKRALQKVRGLVPAGFAAGGALVLGSRGMAGVRREVLTRARSLPPSTEASWILGGIVLQKKLIVIAAVMLAALPLSTIVLSSTFGPRTQLETNHESVERSPSSPRKVADSDVHGSRMPVAPPPRDAAPPAPTAVSVLAVWRGTSLPAARVPIVLSCDRTRRSWSGVSDVDGKLRFTSIAADSIRVAALYGPEQAFEVERGSQTDVVVEVPRGEELRVEVVTPNGRPVPHAEIVLRSLEDITGVVLVDTRADDAGRCELAGLEGGVMIGARYAGFVPSPMRMMTNILAEGHERHAKLRLGERSASLVGQVLDSNGQPLPDAIVCAEPANLAPGEVRRDRTLAVFEASPAFRRVSSDANGWFRVPDAPPGPCTLRVGHAEHAPAKVELTLRAGANEPQTVTLQAGAAIEGRVLDGTGDPVRGAEVWIGAPPEFGIERLSTHSTRADGNGRFELRGLPAGAHRATVRLPNGDVLSDPVHCTAGESSECNFELSARDALCGRVLDPSGRPLAHWQVLAGTSLADSHRVLTDAAGRFRLVRRPDADHVLALFPPRDARTQSLTALFTGVRPSIRPVDLTVHTDSAERGSIRGRALLSDGRPSGGTVIGLYVSGVRVSTGFTGFEGVYRFDELPVGTYEIVANDLLEGHRRMSVECTARAGVLSRAADLRVPD